MKARAMEDNAARKPRVVLPTLKIFFICCMIFSGISLAASQEEASAKPVVVEKTPASKEALADVNAELEALLKANGKCLRCHKREKVKTLEDGTEMSLQVHGEDYTSSAHGEVACVSCHEAIGNRRHPSSKTNITIASEREYSLEMNNNCRKCHSTKFKQYQGSIHSSLVGQGSEKAPLCTDCHSAHAVETMTVYQPETGFPCKNCHEDIFVAYRESVHGSARLSGGNVIRDEHIEAPICSDCHSSHEVVAMEIGDTLRSQCLDCHENVQSLHGQWLPNAGTHLDVVSCAVCHAPFAKHRFDLHFYSRETQKPVGQQETHDLFLRQMKALEEEGGTVDPLEVWRLIEEDNQSTPDSISLRGRMEVRSGIWAHQIAPKSFAVRTCDSCHLAGHRERMGITVSIPQQDGRVQQFDAGKDAMSSAAAVESMGDFSVFGISINKMLDIMFLCSLLAGFAIPIGHFTLGRMIKEKMDRGEL